MRRCICWLPLLAVAIGPAVEATADHAAMPIRTPAVETPIETAGTGLAPEVQVRVHVDARGRIDRVEIPRIDPSSEFDELFRRVTRETLSRWRYAPAIENGAPVAADLEWTIRFPPRDRPPERDPVSFASDLHEISGESEDSFWDRVLRMSDEQRFKLLEEFGTRAERHLDAAHRRDLSSRRFLVFTDHPDPEIAAKLAGNFEATYDVVGNLLAPVVEPRPERFKILAFVFNTKSAYLALNREIPNLDWAAGFYSPAGLVAIHLEMPTNEALLNVMLHEATHAYVDRHVARHGVRFPRWLGEGFADYVGNSTIKNGELIPGRTTRTHIYSTSYGTTMGPSGPAFTVDEVKAAMRRGDALSVGELMSASRETFYGERRRMYYSMSWLLVHYLRHGEAGWAEDEFPKLMLYVAEGYPATQVVGAIYGKTPSELDAGYREYVKKF